jgi:hypothetical protein
MRAYKGKRAGNRRHVMLRIAAALGKPVGEVFWLGQP